MIPEAITIDVEASNRCNAHCDFCPRDLTPHQGTMSHEVFDQSLRRIAEFRELAAGRLEVSVDMAFCGLGEGLLNPRLPDFIRRTARAGFAPNLVSNGSLLTEPRALTLLEAGLRHIWVNCGELGDDYDRTYSVSFEQMRANVLRFMELAGDRCDVGIVLVDARRDPAHMARVRAYWEALGITHFYPSPMLNRGGTLDVASMAFETYAQHARAKHTVAAMDPIPICAAPFVFPFIGYDGQYYLCSSDWEKRVAFGNVFDETIVSIMAAKMQRVLEREPICRTCNHDPVNRLTTALREQDAGADTDDAHVAEVAGIARDETRQVHRWLELFGVVAEVSPPVPAEPRRRIPVRTV